MGHARQRSVKSSVSLGLAALPVCFGCGSTFTSSGGVGDAGAAGDVGSEEAGAAGVSGASTGGASGLAGGGLGGAATAGSMSTGGGTGVSGSSGVAGKAGDCGECFVANQCVDKCGGTVVYTGCCECVAPAVNKNTCVIPF